MQKIKEIKTQHAVQRVDTTFEQSSFWYNKDSLTSFLFVNYDYPMPHTHQDFCEILCVISGEITNYVNDRSRKMHRGDCWLALRDDKHFVLCEKEKRKDFLAINFVIKYEYFLKLKDIFGEKESGVFDSQEDNFFHLDEEMTTLLLNRTYLLQTPNRKYVAEAEFKCRCIIIDLLKELAMAKLKLKEKVNVPQWLKDLLENMQKQENMQKSLDELVGQVPYSYPYVAREFKRFVGTPMVSYFTMLKLRRAEELLLNTRKKILEISSELGYNSLSHFNHIFKKTYGLSPSQFRNEKNIVLKKSKFLKRENGKKQATD